MALNPNRGTPWLGTVSLTPGSLTATVPIKVTRNTAASFVLGPTDRAVILSVVASTNDSVGMPLISSSDNAPTNASPLWKAYLSASGAAPYPVVAASFAPGVLVGFPGTALTATASAVSPTKTVEITVTGIVYTGA